MRLLTFLSICFLGTASLFGQTVVDQRVADARLQTKAPNAGFQAYNDLAAALCRKARDSSDLRVYQQAGEAVDHSLALSANNYDALKWRSIVLAGEHQYRAAFKISQELNKKIPDDIANWAQLAEINMALGDYSEAEKDAQWVLDLRRASALGFQEAAELREYFGDAEGAIEFYGEALTRTAQSDKDQRAWLLTQKARLTFVSGKTDEAERMLREALDFFPGSQAALLVMADVQSAKSKYADAAATLEKCYQAVPSAHNHYLWAQALQRAGEKERGAQELAAFEKQARPDIEKPYNANLDLVRFYLNDANKPGEALRIAQLEAAQRSDCHTLAAYAWALFKNGKAIDAKAQMDKALAVGIQDNTYLRQAKEISQAIGGNGK